MLAGVGSLPIRSAVAGLLVNFVQSLLVANSSNKSKATQLKNLLERCSGEEVLRALGLARLATQSDDYGLLENIDESDSLEEIGQVLLDAIRLGSPDPGAWNFYLIVSLEALYARLGIANTWRARWMSLLTSTAFTLTPFTQGRAFLMMGYLCPDFTEDDLLYQMLLAFKTAMVDVHESDTRIIISIMRCLRRMTLGLLHGSKVLPPLVWLATAFIHSGMSTMFNEASNLLRTIIEALCSTTEYGQRPVVVVFEVAREIMEPALEQIDSAMGLTFHRPFWSFALGTSLFRGTRFASTAKAANELLQTLLKLSAPSPPTQRQQPISHHTIGYFLALLPSCDSMDALEQLVRSAGGGSAWFPERKTTNGKNSSGKTFPVNPHAAARDGMQQARLRLPFGVLGVMDDRTALLVMTFLIGMLYTTTNDIEKELLFGLLAGACEAFPEVTAIT